MTPGRKPSPAAQIIDVPMNESLLAADFSAANQLALATAQQSSAVRAVALQMGYQLPADCTDADLIQRDISANMRRSVEACLEVGKGLRVLKEACSHGSFMSRLDVLGIDDAVGRKFMQAAIKFSKRSTSSVLTKALNNQSQLFELLILDDAQIEELELTGQTGELALDDVATMSVKELRRAVREAKAEKEATDKLLENKNKQLDKLSRHIDAATPETVIAETLAEVNTYGHTALAYIRGDLRKGFAALQALEDGGNTSHRGIMAGFVADLRLQLDILEGDFFLFGDKA